MVNSYAVKLAQFSLAGLAMVLATILNIYSDLDSAATVALISAGLGYGFGYSNGKKQKVIP